ncbi:MAG: prepilin-type N-terminal cleavage/methylation domain-containing protein [Firmicutes bacterium]|nr:prepilin-type N-terminal cleavage/methylation domain-containing protein [Bacillota bacterium]
MKKKIKSLLKNNRGFSLVELIVVIAILIVLMSQLIPAVISYIVKTQKIASVNTARIIYETATLTMTNPEANASFLTATTTGSSVNTSSSVGGALKSINGKPMAIVAYTCVADNRTVGSDGMITWRIRNDWSDYDHMTGKIPKNLCHIMRAAQDAQGGVYAKWLQQDLDSTNLKLEYQAPCKYSDFSNIDRSKKCCMIMILGEHRSKNMEIWAGYKEHPVYRLYPDPDPVYLSSQK